MKMAKLRHIAMVVEDMDKTARFYEGAFGMQRVGQTETAIRLSDGVVSLVIIHPSNVNLKGDSRRGLHHIGFLADDVERDEAQVLANGAVMLGGIINSEDGRVSERKYRDPNGQMFDLTSREHARDTWRIEV
jgi:catechol 2,3-dioxygenase-like lactoylglutathione lyase family enzyme